MTPCSRCPTIAPEGLPGVICERCEAALEQIDADIETDRLNALIDDTEPLLSHLRDQREGLFEDE